MLSGQVLPRMCFHRPLGYHRHHRYQPLSHWVGVGGQHTVLILGAGQHQLTHLQHNLTQSNCWTNVIGGDDVLQTQGTGHKRILCSGRLASK